MGYYHCHRYYYQIYINGVLKIEGRARSLDRGGAPAVARPGRELTVFTEIKMSITFSRARPCASHACNTRCDAAGVDDAPKDIEKCVHFCRNSFSRVISLFKLLYSDDIETRGVPKELSRYDAFLVVPLCLIRRRRGRGRAFPRARHRVVRHVRDPDAAVSSSRWQRVSRGLVRAAGRAARRATALGVVILAVHP